MEFSNFKNPIDVINYYISNYSSLDNQTKMQFDNLFLLEVKDLDAISLINICVVLDRQQTILNERVSTLNLEMASRNGKLNNYGALQHEAQLTKKDVGQIFVELSSDYQKRYHERSLCLSLLSQLSFVRNKIFDYIIKKVADFSEEDRKTLLNELSNKIISFSDRISVLKVELTSRSGKLESQSELEHEAEISNKPVKQVFLELSREYRDKIYEKENLESYIEDYNVFNLIISDIDYINNYSSTK